ncbi:type III restriction endonuclease subunit R [Micromonospora aurantiaca]|uniref:DEAD/DEAH box helicase n=1 Tax=Micromonospora aurantiaca (nom. illeg.) TaxID=47850 RepID=UPI000F3C354F|nr:DEAD/DEAH box helicase family protein [Micromonospora aurantiaca]RNH90365.1 type III restriction endonuclease subunit R [Micromonospora aurantiaca]
MKFTLKDYQADAVGHILGCFTDARDDFHRKGRNVSFSLAATTGAGKTVMAAAVIEGLFFGDSDWDFEADPNAVVLWFTDDPSLNEQTKHRLLEAAGDRIAYSRLQVIGNRFNQEKFEPGKVYFLNSQKLSKNSLLVRGAPDDAQDALIERAASPDLRQYTIWDTLRNTIEDGNLTLYLILDEAHKGMRKPSNNERAEKQTIVKRLINGANGVPPVPVVWGISATIERFTEAMKDAQGRFAYPNYEVDPALIQESGLLKDDIRLDFPAEKGTFDTVLLKRAVRRIKEVTELWAQYAADQDNEADLVIPLLVVQVPNTPSDDLLRTAVDTIREEWPELPADGIGHTFGDHTALEIGDYEVRYIAPEKVQQSLRVRVLLAKEAITTGWDCPRAEVLVSYRPAQDKTHITQMLGRMVRTPLARRIAGDDRLNSVECLLPHFSRTTATEVADILLGKHTEGDDGTGESGGGEGRRVLYKPVDMQVNPAIPDYVWVAFDTLPSQTLPKKAAKPTKRLSSLAQALSRDELLPDARKAAYNELFAVLDGLMARHKDNIEANILGLREVEGETIVASVAGGKIAYTEKFSEVADDRSVEAYFKEAQRILSPDLARKYADRIAVDGDDDDGLLDAHLKVAALARIDGVQAEIEREADALARRWLDRFRVAIKGLRDERRAVYDAIIAMSTDPQRIDILRPKVRSEETEADADGTKVPTRPGHLMSDEAGDFPIGSLNSWETAVLDSERKQPGFLAWYRNPGRASDDSLAIAYKDGKGAWRRMCPDFLFFHGDEHNVKVSIIDPHGYHLGDALPKLRGLASFEFPPL